MPDPMERLDHWYFEHAAPEVELHFREVNRAAAFGARCLVNSWGKRATAELIFPELNEEALFAVVYLECLGDSSPAGFESLPLLPEAPPNYEPGRTWAGEFADLRTQLPLENDELIVLRGRLNDWNIAETGDSPTVPDPDLLAKWGNWLREPPDDDGLIRVRPDALALHTICSRLYSRALVEH